VSRWPVWAYRVLLRLFPEEFRRRYGEEMVDFFVQSWTETRGLGRALVLARAIKDMMAHGVAERAGSGRPRESGRWTMGGSAHDLRLALRGLRRRPGFATVVVLTVALGIGTASAVFAVVDAVVFRPLPYPEPDRLVALWTTFEGQGDFGLSLAEQYDYAAESRALSRLGSFSRGSATLTGIGEATRVDVAWSWGDLYEVMGARAELGRLPGPEDSRTGAAAVAVVSHDFWRAALGADPAVVGQTLELDGRSVEVIGVMAPDVRLPTATVSIWRPIARDREDIVDRSGHSLEGIGRLAPSATLATLRAEIREVETRWDVAWAGVHSPGHPGHSLAASGLHERYFGDLRPAAGVLLGSVLVVLLLACTNVASLLLARGEGRASELALRRALGAGRRRIVRQLLIESLVLSCAGGVIGLILASIGVDVLVRLEPGTLPRADTIGLDPRVTSFAVLATLLSGLAFGVLPAVRAASKVAATRGAVGPDRSLSRSLTSLVVGQVALAVILLAGAGLLTRTVLALADSDVGIRTDQRITFQVSLAQARYSTTEDVRSFWDRLQSETNAVPGIERAAVSRLLPLRDGLRREGMTIEGREAEAGDAGAVAFGLVSRGFFQVLEVPVLEGREFEEIDGPESTRVGIVNRAAADAYWPGQSPVGQRVWAHFLPESAGPITIVGVVDDVLAEGARAGTTPELYLSYAQLTNNLAPWARSGVVVARTLVEPGEVAEPLRMLVGRIDPGIPVTAMSTYEDVADAARARERFLATVLTAFAGLALLIAGMGTYGVVSYSAARRTREFGVRIALGAARAQIVRRILRDGLSLAAAGAALGVGGALLLGPVLGSLLFGVGARDLPSILLGPVVMGIFAVAASAFPALRVSRTDPLEALRDDR